MAGPFSTTKERFLPCPPHTSLRNDVTASPVSVLRLSCGAGLRPSWPLKKAFQKAFQSLGQPATGQWGHFVPVRKKLLLSLHLMALADMVKAVRVYDNREA